MKKTYEAVAWRLIEARLEFEVDVVLDENGEIDFEATYQEAEEYADSSGILGMLDECPRDGSYWYVLEGGDEVREASEDV